VSTMPRRSAITGFSAAAITAGLTVPAIAEVSTPALDEYRAVMARHDEVEASTVWADVTRWCEEEEAALYRLATSSGGLRDLLEKVVVIAARGDNPAWNMMDSEAELIASMGEQAKALLQAGVS
jgi:hypothetical protein